MNAYNELEAFLSSLTESDLLFLVTRLNQVTPRINGIRAYEYSCDYPSTLLVYCKEDNRYESVLDSFKSGCSECKRRASLRTFKRLLNRNDRPISKGFNTKNRL